METILAFVVGMLFAAGVYLLLQRNLMRVLFGIIVLTNAVNVLLLTMGRLTRRAAALLPRGEESLAGTVANPLPQALILTAIVISFGLAAFMLALIYRAEKVFGTLDADDLRIADRENTQS